MTYCEGTNVSRLKQANTRGEKTNSIARHHLDSIYCTIFKSADSIKKAGVVATPEQKKRPRRGCRTSSRTINVVKRQVDACHQITARELKEQNPQLLGQVSVRMVQRCLHDNLEFHRRRALKKPLTTPRQKDLRVAFATKYLQWDMAKWHQVLWSDEAVFMVSCNHGKHVYRRPRSDPLDTKFIFKTEKHPDSVMQLESVDTEPQVGLQLGVVRTRGEHDGKRSNTPTRQISTAVNRFCCSKFRMTVMTDTVSSHHSNQRDAGRYL
ncbi:Transposable element Tc1 transposase [Portunus trituberculatus]|uniref:Transposable element Tc1 transposase n=1 Tax=Portunus trituberculatus TaxID=210409 RepID=A0A5B7EF51_PORTR|nr:Transposable element Tc1 transposase [Portunus trituberculatus]